MMKRAINKKFVIMLVRISLCLGACGINDSNPKDDLMGSEILVTTETAVQISTEVLPMLEEAEQEVALLEKKLTEDASLTQLDMNNLSYEMNMIWDDLLNEFWSVLKDSLDQETMDKLLQEQRTWIAEKEAKVKEAGANYAGGSIAALISNQKAAELTRARVYVLAEYFQ